MVLASQLNSWVVYITFTKTVNYVHSETQHKSLGHCNVADAKKSRGGSSGNGNFWQLKIWSQNMYFGQTSKCQECQPDIWATCPFALVHTNLAGPNDPVAKDIFKYVISFTFDFSGCLLTYFWK